ncbi:MAG: lysylphosphatidylglycerol synthase transmembrane domain-containing protein [Candidatus Saccharibacteria bacterium]|nr:lysylphosphatidylglycerol synthase transmembrane domain-containing protein [Candidatus Saccharibacteria bacterium]
MPKKKSRTRKILLTILFVAINITVIAVTAFSEFGNSENAVKFSEVKFNFWFLIPAIIAFAIALCLEIRKFLMVMKKTCGFKTRAELKKAHKDARRTILIGRYYDNITPAAIGGQPFQIYYMNKNAGVSGGLATTIPIISMISGQIGFLIVAAICFSLGSISINNAPLIAAACFGLLFYAFWPIAVLIATFLPKTTTEIITLGVKLLAKLHIIKDKAAAIKKAEHGVNEYARCVKLILKTRGLFLKTILMSVVFHVLISSIPFFVLHAFGANIDFIPCFVSVVAVTSAVYFIPTPGNAGAAEGTFYVVFSALSSGYIFWAMLVWRFFSYYAYIIFGGFTYLMMHFDKSVKKR